MTIAVIVVLVVALGLYWWAGAAESPGGPEPGALPPDGGAPSTSAEGPAPPQPQPQPLSTGPTPGPTRSPDRTSDGVDAPVDGPPARSSASVAPPSVSAAPGGPAGPAVAPPAPDPEVPSDRPPPMEPGAAAPPLEGSSASTSASPPPPDYRSVTISGPTIDNQYPETTFGIFRVPGEQQCAYVTNNPERGVESDVELVGVRVVGQRPQSPDGDPVFRLYDADVDDVDRLDTARKECRLSSNQSPDVVGSCTRSALAPIVLPPSPSERPTACLLGIENNAEEGTDWTGLVLYDFQVTCTATTSTPCNAPEVLAMGPTPAGPVVVRFSGESRLTACFATTDRYRC